jgi:hypothetical protein
MNPVRLQKIISNHIYDEAGAEFQSLIPGTEINGSLTG